jgi:hypothetical protein
MHVIYLKQNQFLPFKMQNKLEYWGYILTSFKTLVLFYFLRKLITNVNFKEKFDMKFIKLNVDANSLETSQMLSG